LDQINLYGGDVKLFRTPQNGNIWQLKIYIREEQKYYRKSLRTRDEDLARRLADDEYVQIRAKRITGGKIFKVTLHRVIDEWLEEQKLTIGVTKTEGRFGTIKTQTNWLKKFISDPNVYIEDISGDLFMQYYQWRWKKRSTTVSDTLINEKSTIKAIFNFAIEKGYLNSNYRLKFPPLQKSGNKRPALDINEWRAIYTCMRSKKFLNDGDDAKTRHFVRDFTLLLANTGIRFGEARRLKWKDVKVVRGRKDDKKKLIEIDLPREYSKNNKARVIQGRRGDILERIRGYSNYTSKNDYVFVDNKSGQQLPRYSMYRAWHFMLDETGLRQGSKEITFYNLRHTYATWQLYKGVDPYLLKENLGTGLTYLESHYGQVETRKLRDELTKDFDESMRYLIEE
jgi:integrase